MKYKKEIETLQRALAHCQTQAAYWESCVETLKTCEPSAYNDKRQNQAWAHYKQWMNAGARLENQIAEYKRQSHLVNLGVTIPKPATIVRVNG